MSVSIEELGAGVARLGEREHRHSSGSSSGRRASEAWSYGYKSEAVPLHQPQVSTREPVGGATAAVQFECVDLELEEEERAHLDVSKTDGQPLYAVVAPEPVADRIPLGRELGTLETMHEVLTRSFAANKYVDIGGQYNTHRLDMLQEEVGKMAAKVWVMRYVDYTSKYGLGFLLNTGSAGVYFNDSTKIIQSPDGAVFHYFERKRKHGSDSPSQIYDIHSFPPELQKKVTLLKHFRNYLLDPTKEGKQGSSSTGQPPVDFAQTSVANPIQFTTQASGAGTSKTGASAASSLPLPYVKKWVRTRHAILFRLSNQTVQVVFFDQR